MACRNLVAAYFEQFPNAAFQYLVDWGLEDLMRYPIDTQNKPGGWAGGLVRAVAQRSKPTDLRVLNAEMAEIFGVSFGTICKRAVQVADRIDMEKIDILARAARWRGCFHGDLMKIISESGEQSQTTHEMDWLVSKLCNLFGEFLVARANHTEGKL